MVPNRSQQQTLNPGMHSFSQGMGQMSQGMGQMSQGLRIDPSGSPHQQRMFQRSFSPGGMQQMGMSHGQGDLMMGGLMPNEVGQGQGRSMQLINPNHSMPSWQQMNDRFNKLAPDMPGELCLQWFAWLTELHLSI